MPMPRISVRVKDSLLKSIHTEARKRGQKPSSFIRECIVMGLGDDAQQKTPAA